MGGTLVSKVSPLRAPLCPLEESYPPEGGHTGIAGGTHNEGVSPPSSEVSNRVYMRPRRSWHDLARPQKMPFYGGKI